MNSFYDPSTRESMLNVSKILNVRGGTYWGLSLFESSNFIFVNYVNLKRIYNNIGACKL